MGDAQVALAWMGSDYYWGTDEGGDGWCAPHEFLVNTTNVQLEIVPTGGHGFAGRIRAIEAQQNQRVLHHLLRLERYRQLVIPVRDALRGVRREAGVGRDGEDDCGLWFLARVGQRSTARGGRRARRTLRAPCRTCSPAFCTAPAGAAHRRGTSGGCTPRPHNT